MSRQRQISAIDVRMRDRIIQQPMNNFQRTISAPRPNNPYGKNRPNSLLYRLRSGNTQAILTNGCNSMRDICVSVQSITNDITNLLNSVESILPIIATYLALPPKETISISPEAPRLEPSPQVEAAKAKPPQHQPQAPQTMAKENLQTPEQPMQQPAMPRLRPEDLQQLLDNPLIKNLITNFIQNPPSAK